MCQKCVDLSKKLYPDLGEGSSLFVKEIKDTVFNAPHGMDGIRFVQDRTVEYMGMEGVEVREETHAIYIPWTDLLHLILNLGAMYTEEAPEEIKIADAFRMRLGGWFDSDT